MLCRFESQAFSRMQGQNLQPTTNIIVFYESVWLGWAVYKAGREFGDDW